MKLETTKGHVQFGEFVIRALLKSERQTNYYKGSHFEHLSTIFSVIKSQHLPRPNN